MRAGFPEDGASNVHRGSDPEYRLERSCIRLPVTLPVNSRSFFGYYQVYLWVYEARSI